MRFEPFHLEDWLIKCLGAKIDLDHSGAPNPMREGFDPCVGGEAWLNEFEVEDRLYKAIAASYKVKRERIAITSGAQSANFTFLSSCLDRKDKVAVEAPTYAPMRACAKAMSSSSINVPRERGEGYRVNLKAYEAALESGARVTLLTNLHNPSARMLDDEEMKGLLESAERKGALVLVDEVYREMCYGLPPKPAFELGDNGVTTNGLSKLWGLGGLRIGWMIGPEELVERVTEERLYSYWHLPIRSMAVAVKALKRKKWFRDRVLEVAGCNLPIIRDWAAEEARVSITEPQGCLHLLVHLPPKVDDEQFSERLFRKYKTAVCPGRYFGAEGSVRLTFSCDSQDLSKGLEQISQTLDLYC